jgi:formylglycine-generating enzyme required for sulfatase activity
LQRDPGGIEDVLTFAGRIRDIPAHKGMIVTTVGFQQGAVKMAKANGIALVLVSDAGLTWDVVLPATIAAFFSLETALEPAKASDLSTAIRRNPRDHLEYVWIPPGTFLMGSPSTDKEASGVEKPQHAVTITKGFWLSRTPVTVSAYRAFARATGRPMTPSPGFNYGWKEEDHPIGGITWANAKIYCEWAGGRLPTEAEWEYAARGGHEGWKYSWGNDFVPGNCNCGGSGYSGSTPVKMFAPNAYGLFDMFGNFDEWVEDWYDENYYAAIARDGPIEDPRGPTTPRRYRVLRGGCWYSSAEDLRLASRKPGGLDWTMYALGIRCAVDVLPECDIISGDHR